MIADKRIEQVPYQWKGDADKNQGSDCTGIGTVKK
jgi:hypothetical protein